MRGDIPAFNRAILVLKTVLERNVDEQTPSAILSREPGNRFRRHRRPAPADCSTSTNPEALVANRSTPKAEMAATPSPPIRRGALKPGQPIDQIGLQQRGRQARRRLLPAAVVTPRSAKSDSTCCMSSIPGRGRRQRLSPSPRSPHTPNAPFSVGIRQGDRARWDGRARWRPSDDVSGRRNRRSATMRTGDRSPRPGSRQSSLGLSFKCRAAADHDGVVGRRAAYGPRAGPSAPVIHWLSPVWVAILSVQRRRQLQG